MSDRLAICVEREKTHGDFRLNAIISQTIKGAFASMYQVSPETMVYTSWAKLPVVQREALDQIALKISRILSGGHMHKDNWVDIAGYAHLGGEACEKS